MQSSVFGNTVSGSLNTLRRKRLLTAHPIRHRDVICYCMLRIFIVHNAMFDHLVEMISLTPWALHADAYREANYFRLLHRTQKHHNYYIRQPCSGIS